MEVENVADEKEKEEAADVVEVEEVVAAEKEETVAEEEEQVEEVAEERSDKAAEEQEETEAEVQVEEEAVKEAEEAAPEEGKAEEEEEAEEEKPAEVQEEPSLPSPPKLPSTPEKSRRSASPKSSPAASATATSAHSPKSPERRGLSARIRYSKLMFLDLDLQESCMRVFLTGALKFFQGFDGEPSFPEQEQRRGRLPHHQDGDDATSAGLFLFPHHQQGEDSHGGEVTQGRQFLLASGWAGEEEGSQGFFAVASEAGGACTQDPGGEGFPSEGDCRRG